MKNSTKTKKIIITGDNIRSYSETAIQVAKEKGWINKISRISITDVNNDVVFEFSNGINCVCIYTDIDGNVI